jgi:16S rRNA (uracil1498-N3)-methyltransferase
MRLSRFYQAGSYECQASLELTTDVSQHVARVLRMQVGQQIIIFNGVGVQAQAQIISLQKKQVIVKILELSAHNAESNLQINLAQGIAKPQYMDLAVQKAVELGVTSITPLLTEYSAVSMRKEHWEKKLQHWQSIIISACAQSGRATLPLLNDITSFADYLTTSAADLKLILMPDSKIGLPKQGSPSTISLIIGPEGGIAERELHLAQQHDFLPLNLGPRILRTETATIASLSILQYTYGDLNI